MAVLKRVTKLGQFIQNLIEDRRIPRGVLENAIPYISEVMEGGYPPELMENRLCEFFCVFESELKERVCNLIDEQRKTASVPAPAKTNRIVEPVLEDLASTNYVVTEKMLHAMSDEDFNAVQDYAMAVALKVEPGCQDLEIPPVPAVLTGS